MIPPGGESRAYYSTPVAGAGAHDGGALTARIEALLFVSPAPATVAQLSQALRVPPQEVERALGELAADGARRGIRLQRHAGRFQLTTAPEFAAEVEAFLEHEASARLTRAALEILAIIAYHEPVTRPFIDSIRGVNSESALSTLLRHGLVEESGRGEGPGRPILYSTTPDFLRHFGLDHVDQLPPIPAAEAPSEGGAALSPATGDDG